MLNFIKGGCFYFIPTFKSRSFQAADEVGISPQRGMTTGTPGFSAGGCIFLCLILLFTQNAAGAPDYKNTVEKLDNWLRVNQNQSSGLPYSHVGDERFKDWTITYDSAVTALAYIGERKISRAKKIIDFYIGNPGLWRLEGIIEAVNTQNPALGEDWSVRTGSNVWMGIASFHLYKATQDEKYLGLAKKLADFALSLQNNDEKDFNSGGIRLGPLGGANVANDQRIDFDLNQPSFNEIFATEHSIDAYALFNMLYQSTGQTKYKEARDKVLGWLKRVAYNRKEHRFNRGYNRGIDTVVATDIHSWGISALGVEVLDTFETGLAEKLAEFVEAQCVSEVTYLKRGPGKIKVRGADFIDTQTATHLGREPLVSPEWTFQLINAYSRLEMDFKKRLDTNRERKYNKKKQELLQSMLDMAIEVNDTLAYPYATQAQAVIGHGYSTPVKENLSAIGVSYGILAFISFDPLACDD